MENQEVALPVRIAAGDVLGFLGDPRIPDPRDFSAMIRIPAGEFIMGISLQQAQQLLQLLSADPLFTKVTDLEAVLETEQPQRRIYLDEYCIDKYPVTNSQYRQFIEDRGYSREELWSDEGWAWLEWRLEDVNRHRRRFHLDEIREMVPRYLNNSRFNKPNYPAVGVTCYEAEAFARWYGKQLPTEAQWEKAARGTDGRIYPLGNQPPDYKRANYGWYVHRPTPVGLYPSGASSYGLMDMAGNVWEWCADWHDKYYYQNGPSRNPRGPSRGIERVSRGGSWGSMHPYYLRASYRNCWRDPEDWSDQLGFRCASLRFPR